MAKYNYFVIEVKKRNSLYYSVFFERWTTCACASVFDTVLLKSETEIKKDDANIIDLIEEEINKRQWEKNLK